jgi:D-alanine-D-alanine ligase
LKEELRDKRIAVIMGGLSPEREVSMTSGRAVLEALTAGGHDATAVEFSGPSVLDELKAAAPDVVFIALHGSPGEDGPMQGLLEIMNLPYTGSGVLGSAVSMDKATTKMLLGYHGIKTAEFFTAARKDAPGVEALARRIGLSLVVKPANLGSTIGMGFVHSWEELGPAVDEAFRHDESIVVERYIEGRELTVGILSGRALPVVEIIAPGGVYDYTAKYRSGETRYVCPAQIDEKTAAMLQDIALKVFEILHGYGMGRVDFRLSPSGDAYVLEMNTIPGLTGTSLLPKAAKAAGIDFLELIETMLSDALVRHGKQI